MPVRSGLGSVLFAATVLPADAEGRHEPIGIGVYDLANGSITATVHYATNDPSDASAGPSEDFVHPVTGGTGAFAGAHGTVTTAGADGRRAHGFALSCAE
jgi:hypothetical protein